MSTDNQKSKADKNVVYQHVKGGGRFYTSYDPEKTYEDDEHHLIVAKDVTTEMAQSLCHERANENATGFLDTLPDFLRNAKTDFEIREMLGADPVVDNSEVFKASNAEYKKFMEEHMDEQKEFPDASEYGTRVGDLYNDDLLYTSENGIDLDKMPDDAPLTFFVPDNTISFNIGEQGEMLKLCENGDIFVKGVLVENDKDVVDGMRKMIETFTGVRNDDWRSHMESDNSVKVENNETKDLREE